MLVNVRCTWLDLRYAVFTTADGSLRRVYLRCLMVDADAGGHRHRTGDMGHMTYGLDPDILWSQEWRITNGAQFGYHKTHWYVSFRLRSPASGGADATTVPHSWTCTTYGWVNVPFHSSYFCPA